VNASILCFDVALVLFAAVAIEQVTNWKLDDWLQLVPLSMIIMCMSIFQFIKKVIA
jgi:hypothetical protein